MPIIKDTNKKIRQISKDVTFPLDDKMKSICEEMIKYIDDSQKDETLERAGVGIAAVQLGYLYNMFYIKMDEIHFIDLIINPKIITEGYLPCALSNGEGCLSVDETKTNKKKIEGYVHRKYKIGIKGFSYLQNKEVEYIKSGYAAIVIQHELDHLMGKLFYDRINKKNPWKKLQNEEII